MSKFDDVLKNISEQVGVSVQQTQTSGTVNNQNKLPVNTNQPNAIVLALANTKSADDVTNLLKDTKNQKLVTDLINQLQKQPQTQLTQQPAV